MRIPLSWISLYSQLSAPTHSVLQKYAIKELAHIYSVHTAEIDHIYTHHIDRVVVGKVVSCTRHPDSTKLSICEVDMGIHGHTTILTGAANIVDAQYVIVAMVGAVLPGDFTISDRKMAGMTSSGMICGADEIGISGVVATGIMILEDTWPIDILQDMVGKSFFDLCVPTPGLHGSTYSFPLGGYTLEIDNKFITNRPDLFSVHGNAREFGAVCDIPFSPYTSTYDMQDILSNAKTRNTKIDTKNVLSYHLLEMHDIQVGYSPLGIDTMLHYAGIGSKMDIVDITNAISVELGQPMHVYDADRIDGDIVVRMAVDGEKLLALNNIEYTLTSDDIVIADQVRVLGIAGVIGGMYSAVGTETKNIVWESGCFDPTTIRLTAQRHGIRTDASTRYEKSLDPLSAYMALPRILEYMDFLGKHTPVVAASTYTDSTRVRDIVIEISPTYISTRAGVYIPTDRIVYILEKLGFGILENPLEKVGRGMDVSIAGTLSHDNILSISVPSWRATKDVSIPEDICEEVIRIYGYENIPMKSLDSEFSIGTKNHEKTLEYTTIDYLSSIWWDEVYNYSFTNEKLDTYIGYIDMSTAVGIQNAFNVEYTHMRRSLVPRLLENIANNTKYAEKLSMYEIGNIYSKRLEIRDQILENTDIPKGRTNPNFLEKKMICGAILGYTLEDIRTTLDTYMALVLPGQTVHIRNNENAPAYMHPGVCGQYMVDGNVCITFGRIHPSVAASFCISPDTYIWEGDYECILSLSRYSLLSYREISRYQHIPRELNFVMPERTPTGDIATYIQSLHTYIHDIVVIDTYRDAVRIGEGKKSITYRFDLSNTSWNIADTEAQDIQNMIIENMAEKGYMIRGM